MDVKSCVLKRLEENRGCYISGEALSKEAGVSRQAIWKAVKSLIAEGYTVASVTNKGYMLDWKCDLLSASVIAEKTGADVYCYDEVTSTNSVALLKYDRKKDCIVVADSQINGRKKNGEKFVSPPDKGVYMSVATQFSFPLSKAQEMRRRVASAVAETLQSTCKIALTVENDDELFSDGKKVCGILVEAKVNLATLCAFEGVIGIGIYTAEIDGVLGYVTSPETRNSLISEIYLNLKKRLS